ncbi:hypothetical protein BDQ17DRAFT_1420460 [Cyathus striatus]|nr:hypothetical protein BDQ17DRAFT_1420460 [Cyathus striatus]
MAGIEERMYHLLHVDGTGSLRLEKAKRAKVVTFLDLEAEVASGSEDEDDEEQPDEFIVNNEDDDDEDPNIPVYWLELACSVQALYARPLLHMEYT